MLLSAAPWRRSTRNSLVAEQLVLETSAFLDLLLGTGEGRAVRDALVGRQVHISDHQGVAVAAALRALVRGKLLSSATSQEKIRRVLDAPFQAHPARELLAAAAARTELRLGDALCVELSQQLGAPLVTTDSRLAAAWPRSWLVTVGLGPGSRSI